MKNFIFFFVLFSCATVPSQLTVEEERSLRSEISRMESTLENLTYAVHRPIYSGGEE